MLPAESEGSFRRAKERANLCWLGRLVPQLYTKPPFLLMSASLRYHTRNRPIILSCTDCWVLRSRVRKHTGVFSPSARHTHAFVNASRMHGEPARLPRFSAPRSIYLLHRPQTSTLLPTPPPPRPRLRCQQWGFRFDCRVTPTTPCTWRAYLEMLPSASWLTSSGLSRVIFLCG